MSASAAEVGRKVICADGWRVTMHIEVRRGPYKGQIVSARDLPTGCQQQCSLVVPTVRAPRCLTDRAPSHIRSSRRSDRREGRRGQPAPGSAFQRDAATADQRLMTRTLPLPPLQADRTRSEAALDGVREIPHHPASGAMFATLRQAVISQVPMLLATG
jgi:hypothetical protein